MFSRIISLVLVLALVVAGFWGYREHKEKQALLLKAENQYQRAFHDLSDHMNRIQDELGKSLAVNSKQQLTPALTETWRMASEARNDIGQLPLSLMPLNKTMEFISDVGNYSYQVAVRNENKQALNEQEWQTLQKLYTRSKEIENQLADLQTAVITKNLRWMDAETALAQTDKKTDNQIVDGFRAMEKTVEQQKPLSFGPTMDRMKVNSKLDAKTLTGNDVTPEQAASMIQKWRGLDSTKNISVKRNGKGELYPSYSITYTAPDKHKEFFEMTVKGGNITWFMNQRQVGNESLDLAQGENFAVNWLKAHGIDASAVVKTETYDNVGVYEVVGLKNGVRIYPDEVTVEVALDTGEVVGLNARDYVFHHKQNRSIPQTKVTKAKAQKMVSSKVQVQESNLALVLNDAKQEELAYEFIGTMDQDTFKIYISAIDGQEVGVEKVR